MKTYYLLSGALLCLLLVCIILESLFRPRARWIFEQVLPKFINSILRNRKVRLKDLQQARKCCGKVLGIELLVVIWIDGRQTCWLAWGNLNLRSLLLFPFFLRWLLLLLAQLVSISFFGENWIIVVWSGHCLILVLGI